MNHWNKFGWFAIVGIVLVLQGSAVRDTPSDASLTRSLPLAVLSPNDVTPTRSLPLAVPAPTSKSQQRARNAALAEVYGKLPLSFEENRGQVDGKVSFLSRGSGYTLFLTPTEAVLSLSAKIPKPQDGARRTRQDQSTRAKSSVLRMKLVGANPSPEIAGFEALPGKSNYFIGNDPAKWRTNLATYARVKYQEVYPGIDLVYYGNQRQLEYDWIVSPGADPDTIRFAVEGAKKIKLDTNGDLVLAVSGGEVRLHKPVVYQETDGVRHEIAGSYVTKKNQEIALGLGDYDAAKPLVIDPILAYSTYLGDSVHDEGSSIAVDSSGNAYVTGATSSSNFPTINSLQPANAGQNDVFVTKFNLSGSLPVYSTYHGGTGSDAGYGIAVDSSGNAYVTGWTDSTNFPTVNPFQGSNAGEADAFVTKFNSSGSALIFSTYLGGNAGDLGYGITVDTSGNPYVTGETHSTNFPLASPLQAAYAGGADAFVTKFNSSASALVFSTYHGGSDDDVAFGIAIDSSGNGYVAGHTWSTNFPTANPLQPASGGLLDAFATKLNPSGSAFVYSTYHGGNGADFARGVAVDSSGNAYVTGATTSINFPTANALQPAHAGQNDAFVTKFNPSGSALVYSTYHGGSANDVGLGIAVNTSGNAYVTGATTSPDFPTVNPLQAVHAGQDDAFVIKLNTAGSSLIYSTYHGSSLFDFGRSIALDSSANAYVAGMTLSNDFPTANPLQPGHGGGSSDAFVIKISDQITLSASPATVSPGGTITATWTNIASPTANDWIGLYSGPGAANTAFISYRYTNGLASSSLPFTIPGGAAAGTTYELRLFSDDGYTRLATSNSFTVQVPTLSVNPTTVHQGGSVTATWTGISNPSATDWIGLYSSSSAGNSSFLRYQYTDGQASSNVLFQIPAGAPAVTTYELRLFSNNSYTRLATSNSFAVQATTLSMSPTTVSAGGSVTATWANILNPSATDWIGLYASPGAGNINFLSYRYTNGQASGNLPFTIPAGTPAGTTYELRLFSNDGYTRLATSNSFAVQATTLSMSPTTVSAGGSVTATWANILNPSATDWIGLYASPGAGNRNFLSYRYTNGQASGNLPFTIPASTPAGTTYELRLFSNDGYTRLATSNSFTVQLTTLSVAPTVVNTGGSVTATWANIASPTANDWLGLYSSPGAANTAYISYRYTNGQASGSLPFHIPADVTPGTRVGGVLGSTYELRLFSNGGYIRLATSNSFTIQEVVLNVGPTTVSPGGVVTASWANIASPTASDWIGLYATPGAANNSFISYRYTNGQASSDLPFTIPGGTPPGMTYELRLFINNGYTRVATSNTFTVQ